MPKIRNELSKSNVVPKQLFGDPPGELFGDPSGEFGGFFPPFNPVFGFPPPPTPGAPLFNAPAGLDRLGGLFGLPDPGLPSPADRGNGKGNGTAIGIGKGVSFDFD
jgi:hypothetical protein